MFQTQTHQIESVLQRPGLRATIPRVAMLWAMTTHLSETWNWNCQVERLVPWHPTKAPLPSLALECSKATRRILVASVSCLRQRTGVAVAWWKAWTSGWSESRLPCCCCCLSLPHHSLICPTTTKTYSGLDCKQPFKWTPESIVQQKVLFILLQHSYNDHFGYI